MAIWISLEFLLFNFEVSIYYAPESDFRVKSFDHLNFLRASVVQFRACRLIMSPNRTSVWKFMTIGISWELLLFNFEQLDILCAWIGHTSKKLWPFEFLESFPRSISSVLLSYVLKSNIRVKSYNHLNFSRVSVVQFRASHILCTWIGNTCQKLWQFEFLESFRCSIFSVLISYVPKLDIRVKSYDHLNFSRAYVVKFQESR